MQIAYVRGSACSPGSGPTIWERFKVDGDGDGQTSIFDPADAIFTAASILRKVLGAPLAGGSYAAYRQAACGYYGACGDSVADYADEVMARAVEYGFRGKGSPPPEDPKRVEPVQSGGNGGGSSCGANFASAGGATGNEIVRIAESQLGRAESPPGSNCNPYGPCVEWCSLFVAWVWEKAGVPLKGGTAPYAYSGSIYEWAQAHEAPLLGLRAAQGESPLSGAQPNGARVLPPTATPAPGDAVLYGQDAQHSDHIGIVEVGADSGGSTATVTTTQAAPVFHWRFRRRQCAERRQYPQRPKFADRPDRRHLAPGRHRDGPLPARLVRIARWRLCRPEIPEL